MKNGTTVRLIQPVIQGEVQERRINPLSDELELLVSFKDAAGEPQLRWFEATQMQAVDPAAAEEPAQ